MTNPRSSCPMTYRQAVDTYFLEHRSKLIDVAAFLDRLDRASDQQKPAQEDHRVAALRNAMSILLDGQPDRAKRVLEQLSDPSRSPTDTTSPPASGAHHDTQDQTTP